VKARHGKRKDFASSRLYRQQAAQKSEHAEGGQERSGVCVDAAAQQAERQAVMRMGGRTDVRCVRSFLKE